MLRLFEQKEELGVIDDQIGTPTYGKDLAQVILEIINVNSKDYGIYNYSNIGTTNWYDFAVTIFKFIEVNIKVNPISTKDYPTLAKRPAYSVLDTTKIKRTFNIQIPNWKDSLKVAISNLK